MIDTNENFDSKQELQKMLDDVKEVGKTAEKTRFRVSKRDFNKWFNAKNERLSLCQKFVIQHKNGINLLLKDGIPTKQIARYLIESCRLSFSPTSLSRNIEKICVQKI